MKKLMHLTPIDTCFLQFQRFIFQSVLPFFFFLPFLVYFVVYSFLDSFFSSLNNTVVQPTRKKKLIRRAPLSLLAHVLFVAKCIFISMIMYVLCQGPRKEPCSFFPRFFFFFRSFLLTACPHYFSLVVTNCTFIFKITYFLCQGPRKDSCSFFPYFQMRRRISIRSWVRPSIRPSACMSRVIFEGEKNAY